MYRKFSQKTKDAVINDYKNTPLSTVKISAKHGCSAASVHAWDKDSGVTRDQLVPHHRKRHFDRSESYTMMAAYWATEQEGCRWDMQFCAMNGISISTLFRWKKKYPKPAANNPVQAVPIADKPMIMHIVPKEPLTLTETPALAALTAEISRHASVLALLEAARRALNGNY